VAGPAGLKRDSAKVRGIVKQWAVGAVLRECEAMGLRQAIGPLWAVLVAAIERDPTAAMLALQIDVNGIRPAAIAPTRQPHSKVIGLADSPIGLEKGPIGLANEAQKHQALSCVGLASQKPQTTATNGTQATGQPTAEQPAITTLAELWEAVGCRSQRVTRTPDRLIVARAAQQSAIARHTPKPSTRPTAPAIRVGDDGTIRVRDEHAHDLSAWH